VVGVNRPNDGQAASLSYAQKDARDVAALLRSAGYSVTTLARQSDAAHDPVRSSVIKSLHGICAEAGPDDLVLFYFSGHGYTKESEDYLQLQDAELRVSALIDAVATSRARQHVLILDACRTPRDKGPTERELLLENLRSSEGVAALASSARGLPSWEPVSEEKDAHGNPMENGVFTHYLLLGLDGAADANADGSLTLNELGAYVYGQVRKHALQAVRDLSPELQWCGKPGGDFLLRELPPDRAAASGKSRGVCFYLELDPALGAESREALAWLREVPGTVWVEHEAQASHVLTLELKEPCERNRLGALACSGWPTFRVVATGTEGQAPRTIREGLLAMDSKGKPEGNSRGDPDEARRRALLQGLLIMTEAEPMRRTVIEALQAALGAPREHTSREENQ
jgi:hypothetical protein